MIRLLALVATATVAHAEIVTLPNSRVTFDLPAGWKTVSAEGVVLGAKGPTGEVLAVTRAQVPNPDAWRTKKREAYVDQIEKGALGKLKGKRVSRKLADVATIPTLDLEFRKDDGATVVLRVLLYRTYALSLAIEVPKNGTAKAARAIVQTFSPPQPAQGSGSS